jgi:Flp pilus assembly protein protease CpaA
VALWIGLDLLPSFLTVLAISGGVLGLMLLPLRRFAAATASGASLPPSLVAGAPMPYGLAIAIAAILIDVRPIG